VFLALALSIALHQDYFSWPTDTALLFAASLIGLVLTFPSHFLTSSEDFAKSKRRNMYFLLAGNVPSQSPQYPVHSFGWRGIVPRCVLLCCRNLMLIGSLYSIRWVWIVFGSFYLRPRHKRQRKM